MHSEEWFINYVNGKAKIVTYESKTPKDIDVGTRVTCSGVFVSREHTVRPFTSSYVALGSRATDMNETQGKQRDVNGEAYCF